MTATPTRIVLTRSLETNRPWRIALEAVGMTVLVVPMVRFEPQPLPWDLDPGSFDWILFTSPQGVRAFCDAGLQHGDARLGALGGGTSATLAACGLRDDLNAPTKTGAELARFFAEQFTPPASILLPGPLNRLSEPRLTLAETGFAVTELPLYSTEPVPTADLPEAPFADGDVIFFCSPSAIASFVATYDERPPCVAIGETTAVAARQTGFDVATADEPSLGGMARTCGVVIDALPDPAES